MIISTEVTETSVTITDYRLSQLLRSTLIWKIKLRGPKVLVFKLLCLTQTIKSGSCEIIKVLVIIDVYVRANKSIWESFHCAE